MAIVAVQYDLFTPKPTEIEILRMEFESLNVSHHKVRRGTYCELNKEKKRINELEERLSILERYICKGNT